MRTPTQKHGLSLTIFAQLRALEANRRLSEHEEAIRARFESLSKEEQQARRQAVRERLLAEHRFYRQIQGRNSFEAIVDGELRRELEAEIVREAA